MRKVVLIKTSEGQRGQEGRKKIYEITIAGNVVTFSWGKAEENKRQTLTKVFAQEWQAVNYAYEKQDQKVAKGYQVAFTA